MTEIPTGGFTDGEQLKKWLSQPFGLNSQPYAMTLATRAILRGIPFVAPDLSQANPRLADSEFDVGDPLRVLIAVFRATIITIIRSPNSANALINAAENASSLNSSIHFDSESAILDCWLAAQSTLNIARHLDPATNAVEAIYRVNSILSYDRTIQMPRQEMDKNGIAYAKNFGFIEDLSSSEMWKEVSEDAKYLSTKGNHVNLLNRSIWTNDRPIVWSKALASFQATLAAIENNLGGLKNRNWTIWLDWYNARSAGRPAFDLPQHIAEAVEMRIALGDDRKDFWDREPYEINAEIAKWVEAAREALTPRTNELESIELPQQNPEAPTFSTNESGIIDRSTIPPEHRLLQTPDQKREYDACRADAFHFKEIGANRLGQVALQLDALLDAMPEDISDAIIFNVWRGINRLRRTYNAHVEVGPNADGDDARLDGAVGEELGHLLDSLNNFAFGDPSLRERDQRRIAPQDRVTQREELRLGAQIIDAVIENAKISTETARNILKQEIENVKNAGESEHDAQAIEQANKTHQNFIVALFSAAKSAIGKVSRLAKKEADFALGGIKTGAYGAVGYGAASDALFGTTYYSYILTFIAQNAPALKIYSIEVLTHPNLVVVIDFITGIFL